MACRVSSDDSESPLVRSECLFLLANACTYGGGVLDDSCTTVLEVIPSVGRMLARASKHVEEFKRLTTAGGQNGLGGDDESVSNASDIYDYSSSSISKNKQTDGLLLAPPTLLRAGMKLVSERTSRNKIKLTATHYPLLNQPTQFVLHLLRSAQLRSLLAVSLSSATTTNADNGNGNVTIDLNTTHQTDTDLGSSIGDEDYTVSPNSSMESSFSQDELASHFYDSGILSHCITLLDFEGVKDCCLHSSLAHLNLDISVYEEAGGAENLGGFGGERASEPLRKTRMYNPRR